MKTKQNNKTMTDEEILDTLKWIPAFEVKTDSEGEWIVTDDTSNDIAEGVESLRAYVAELPKTLEDYKSGREELQRVLNQEVDELETMRNRLRELIYNEAEETPYLEAAFDAVDEAHSDACVKAMGLDETWMSRNGFIKAREFSEFHGDMIEREMLRFLDGWEECYISAFRAEMNDSGDEEVARDVAYEELYNR